MAAIQRYDRSEAGSSRGTAQSARTAQLARARHERRRQAEAQAHRLLAEAHRTAPDMIIPHTLRLLSQALRVDHVTLAVGPETRPQGLFYANPRGATAVSWSDLACALEPPISPPVDGAVSRLHAFVYAAGDPELRGCLSLHSMQARSFRALEVALVDALAELLAGELARCRAESGRVEAAETPARRVSHAGV